MKLLRFKDVSDRSVAIIADKITGFVCCEQSAGNFGNTFIATGADGPDGEGNGFYVVEKFDTVSAVIQSS